MSSSSQTASGGAGTNRLQRSQVFATTHWSVVLRAGHSDSTQASNALAKLCRVYWYPLYAYARQRGYSPADAEDLTQEFFARLLDKKILSAVTRDKGKFRSFLLASFNHLMTDQWKKARAQKRGGGKVWSLDAATAETRFSHEPVDAKTPELLFQQNWALALLDSVYEQLRQEYDAQGKAALFDALKFCLTGSRSSMPYAELAARLALAENTVKVMVHRLRQRYRQLLRDEVANTVATPDEVEEELRCLFRTLTL